MRLLRLAALLGLLGLSATARRVNKIITLMLENHSFDNMLGLLNKTRRGVNATAPSCNVQASSGRTYCATRQGAYVDPDPDHSVDGTSWQLYGTPNPAHSLDPSTITLGGFVDSYSSAVSPAAGGSIMDCMDPSHVPIISTLAQSFTLVDTYFAGVPGPTYVNRLFYLSGTSHGYGDNDLAQTVLGWPQRSIFGALNSSQWRVYFSDVPSALLMADARMGLLEGNYKLIESFAADAAKGDLPEFTFIEPGFIDIPSLPATDQHPAHDVRDGERMVKGVYEALRASPLWNESVLLLVSGQPGVQAPPAWEEELPHRTSPPLSPHTPPPHSRPTTSTAASMTLCPRQWACPPLTACPAGTASTLTPSTLPAWACACPCWSSAPGPLPPQRPWRPLAAPMSTPPCPPPCALPSLLPSLPPSQPGMPGPRP